MSERESGQKGQWFSKASDLASGAGKGSVGICFCDFGKGFGGGSGGWRRGDRGGER